MAEHYWIGDSPTPSETGPVQEQLDTLPFTWFEDVNQQARNLYPFLRTVAVDAQCATSVWVFWVSWRNTGPPHFRDEECGRKLVFYFRPRWIQVVQALVNDDGVFWSHLGSMTWRCNGLLVLTRIEQLLDFVPWNSVVSRFNSPVSVNENWMRMMFPDPPTVRAGANKPVLRRCFGCAYTRWVVQDEFDFSTDDPYPKFLLCSTCDNLGLSPNVAVSASPVNCHLLESRVAWFRRQVENLTLHSGEVLI